MTFRCSCFVAVLVAQAMVTSALAQDVGVGAQMPANDRITAPDDNADAILTTHKLAPKPQAPAAATTPLAAMPTPAPVAEPVASPPAPLPFANAKPVAPAAPSKAVLPTKVPFGHASDSGPSSYIPSEPHTAVATPVGNVDAVEVTQPAAPPTPTPPGANPVAEDPTAPTELTSPLFDESDDLTLPRKIEVRVLNKVTAQSTLFKAKPGDVVKFGRLEITTINCRISSPNSQPDSAGLFDIREHLASSNIIKTLFHGWMYASSPSIAALEHPIYDVMMVNCDVATPPGKTEAKSAKKAK